MNNKLKSNKKTYTYFIGVDVSKNTLDYAVMSGKDLLFHEEGKNTADEIFVFLEKLKGLPGFTMQKALFCMENTGFYANPLVFCLERVKANFVLEHPIQIKRSLGLIRNKNDRTDAIRIASYTEKNFAELKLWSPNRSVITDLSSLLTLRNRLLGVSVAIKNPISEQERFIAEQRHIQTKRMCERTTQAVKADLVEINLKIEEIIENDDELKRLKKLVTSVPGIGPVTAAQIIISTNEFKNISTAKKFACYAGVVPFSQQSGLRPGRPKISPYANKKVKSLLHICALSAIKSDPETREYYRRKTQQEGKPGLSVVNAVRNKLVIKVFACVKNNQSFLKNYNKINQSNVPVVDN